MVSEQIVYSSPLRYPGGKTRLTTFLEDIILLNNLENCTFYELYAGGAGVSLNLLFSGICNRIVLNDLDFHIYAFWYSILNDTENFLRLLSDTPVDVNTWQAQKDIYQNHKDYSRLKVGFSAFFLNRTNRSGILHRSGPIGGHDQTGNYKIDVRYNKHMLTQRIEKIADLQSKIEIKNLETVQLLESLFDEDQGLRFVFLDPPYYNQGERLYFSAYTDKDHEALRDVLSKYSNENWFLTYDNCHRINQLYTSFRRSNQLMSYTLQDKKETKEVLIFSDSLYLPKRYNSGSKSRKLVIKQ